MSKLVFVSLFLFSSLSYASYEPPWAKLCQGRLTNKQNLYEVYHDCIDLCMLTSVEHKHLKMKEKHRICTFFTAKLHNKQTKSLDVKQSLGIGLQFCTDQKIHKNGGHWLYVSRQCKRMICEDKSENIQRQNATCKAMNNHLNNGRLIEAYQKPTESDRQRRGTTPNTLLKEGQPTAPLESEPAQPVKNSTAP